MRIKSNFENLMRNWNPETHNLKYKRLPIFRGIVGREYISGFTYVDSGIYDHLSKVMWIKPSKYVLFNYTLRNCERLNIPHEGCKKNPMLLHRTVLNTNHFCDHINNLTLDNRLSNLRNASIHQNNRNVRKRKNSKNKYKGVKFLKNRGNKPYTATAYLKGVYNNNNIGFFEEQDHAAIAYDLVALQIDYEFSFTNFPKERYQGILDKDVLFVIDYLTKSKRGNKWNLDYVLEKSKLGADLI